MKADDSEYKWITLKNGSHVLIKKDQIKKQAIEKFLKRKKSYKLSEDFKKDKSYYELKNRKEIEKELGNTNSGYLSKNFIKKDNKYIMKTEKRKKIEEKLGIRRYN